MAKSREITITIPAHLQWVIEYYEEKAQIRNKIEHPLPADKALNRELVTALEQYAIQGFKKTPNFKALFDESGRTEP